MSDRQVSRAPGRAAVAERGGFGQRPLRFDPELVADLLARHAVLQARVAGLDELFAQDMDGALTEARACAEQLHELRQWEAIRLYPAVSRGLYGDAVAERQWVILRFVINGLAHRLLHSMEALGTVHDAASAGGAIDAVLENLAAYRARNESDVYPLYTAMDPSRTRRRA